MKVANTASTGVQVKNTGLDGRYARFAGGFPAWNGNHTNAGTGLNVLTQVQLRNGTTFVAPADAPAAAALGWSIALYSADAAGETAAFAATGYSGLRATRSSRGARY